MRHGSLFSGIGGFDLAAEWMGWENVFHCEWNEFGQKVLKHYFPEAESFNDITKSDFTKYEGTVDIISGGFPCQPYSMAVKRKGKEDERHLWPQMLRVIREVKPRFVVGENVFGLLNWNGGMVFDEVHADLEAEGYQVQAVVIPAASVNAPHGRDRVWFIAYSDSISNRREREQSQNSCEQRRSSETDKRERSNWEQQSICNSAVSGDVTNSESIRRENALENRELERRRFRFGSKPQTWNTFPLESPICGGDDGFSNRLDGITFSKWRAESIKGYGNAIVPQVAYEIFKQL
jgi:DNA (cytosine-5)-methyltransferase 1